ncbi:MAG: ImmA/IrrE family metallo-endopeptidase [Thermoguttaceae bacterium]|jgi:hypothetical protein
MTGFSGHFLEIQPRELVKYLLRAAGQYERESVNPVDLLDLLGLAFTSFDFQLELSDDAKQTIGGAKPRALISFADRLVATDVGLSETKTRFSVLHEIGHFVLPKHQHKLFICDDQGLTLAARLVLEKEASEFAADLLFLGDRFSLEANNRPLSAMTVKELARKYRASFEATARRLVEKSFHECMLVVFQQDATKAQIDDAQAPTWSVRYCVASPSFKVRYFTGVQGTVPSETAALVAQPGRDIAESVVIDVTLASPTDHSDLPFQAEFFYNRWNIFCLLTPKKPVV